MKTSEIFQRGDTIPCHDVDEMLEIDRVLNEEGYVTEFCYQHKDERGLWIVIEGRHE